MDRGQSSGRMLRVAMLVHNPMTTDARVMREAATLGAAGHDVVVFALAGESLPPSEQRDGFRIERVAEKTTASWRSPFRKWRQLRRRAAALVAAAVESSPDVVHCHDTDTLPAGMEVSRATGASVVYDAHELFPDMLAGHGRDSRLVMRYWTRIERDLIPRADAVICVNAERAEVIRERYGVRSVIVPSYPEVEPLVRSGRLRAELGVGQDVPIVLYQGGLSGGRGLVRLVDAVATLPGAVLAVQGDGPEADRMRSRAAELGMVDRLRLMGWAPPEALHEYACDADAGVVIYEATSLNNYLAAPNKLWSYLMAGLPVVASDFPGLRAVVDGERVGALFDPLEAASIAEALRAVLAEGDERAAMARRARRAAEERYNWTVAGRRLLDVYEGIRA